MMDRRAFLLSLGLSALAMFLVWQYISNEDQSLMDKYGKKEGVVVATRDILQYETIRPTDVETQSVPADLLPPGRVNSKEDTYDAVASIPISKGEFILDNKIISKNIYSGLDTQIARTKRAMSVPVNIKSSHSFLLRPGNRVDLAAHFEFKAAGANLSEVKVFMQDLLVLAVGRTIQTDTPKAVDQSVIASLTNTRGPTSKDAELRDTLNYAKTDTNFQTVTLEVTPQQAQQVLFVLSAYGMDSVSVLLRHSDDRQLERMGTTNLLGVMGPDSFYARGNKAPPQRTVPKIKYFDLQGETPVPVY